MPSQAPRPIHRAKVSRETILLANRVSRDYAYCVRGHGMPCPPIGGIDIAAGVSSSTELF